LRVVFAESNDDVALAVAALAALATVTVVAALLTLASNAELFALAILVRIAGRVLRLA
jgi:hypothetical protein